MACADGIGIALEADANGVYAHMGDTDGNANNGEGTCVEADGDEAVHSLTSETEFLYLRSGRRRRDTVMYARSHCGVQAAELACNDDAAVGEDGNIGSRVSLCGSRRDRLRFRRRVLRRRYLPLRVDLYCRVRLTRVYS